MTSMTDEVKAAARHGISTRRTEYLGDGLYAGLEGDMIVLSCDREDGEHVVYLDHAVFTAFMWFVAHNLEQWAREW